MIFVKKNICPNKRKVLNNIFVYCRGERACYYGNRLKAEQEPKKYLSVIVDGMDQAKTNLPHITRISKVTGGFPPYSSFLSS